MTSLKDIGILYNTLRRGSVSVEQLWYLNVKCKYKIKYIIPPR